MNTRILFVDDEPNVLSGLRRLLRPMRSEWDLCFATSGAQALEELQRGAFDVIVSDMRMPKMNGAELLARVRVEHPHVVRFILSGHADQKLILEAVCTAHQYLSKPCDAGLLEETIARTRALHGLLDDGRLESLVSGIGSLPSCPSSYAEIMRELQADEPCLHAVGRIIATDVGMAAKILQLVNSAFFGLRREIADLTEAVRFLGLGTMRGLILSTHVFAQFESGPSGFSVEELWRHSLQVASLARAIARDACDEPDVADNAYLAGLLHDVGKLILADHLRERYASLLTAAARDGVPEDSVEAQALGCTHAQLGAYLLGLWGVADSIVAAVCYHHAPSACPTSRFSPLTAVHVADALAAPAARAPVALDAEHLGRVGCEPRLAHWRSLCEGELARLRHA